MVVAFETLFLGLVMGTVSVRVMVEPTVAAVELRLDDERVGDLRAPSWSMKVDLGARPAPHELVAVARSVSGSELGRARQRINLPRPDAEVSVVLVRNPEGRTIARLAWDESEGLEPSKVEAALDGEPLKATGADRIELPAVDPALPHVFSVTLSFAQSASARADVAFGGDLVESLRTELTALPLVLDSELRPPAVTALQGWFEARGSPLRVVGLEKGAAEVVFVFDQHAAGRLRARWIDYRYRGPISGRARLAPGTQDDRFSVVIPTPRSVVSHKDNLRNLFPIVGPAVLDPDALATVGLNLPFNVAFLDSQPLGNAVCLAGLRAAGSGRRRAVVLVLASDGRGGGTVSPEMARGFLADLHVPFRVWSIEDAPEKRAATLWGDAEDASLHRHLESALRRLNKELDLQKIVWFEGSLLPQYVTLTERAGRAHLAP